MKRKHILIASVALMATSFLESCSDEFLQDKKNYDYASPQDALDKKNKKPQNYLNRERLYDNQDICLLLNISKRMLQRYRDNGLSIHDPA